MERQRIYPVGEQSFENIRNSGALYVDKTEYVYRMTHSGSPAVFLSRPRRFGKSLLCSTLKHYFLGHRELFKGLAIDLMEREWAVYPVLHFDMANCKRDTIDAVKLNLNMMIGEYEDLYHCRLDVDDYGARLSNLIKRAHQQSGQKVVLIFDEYDSPMLNVIADKDKLDEIRSIYNSFYGPVKSMFEHLRFVFLTGITKFSQMSIFSTINNLNNITMERDYEGICGITASELERQLAPDITMLARSFQRPRETVLDSLRERYDGYRFGPGLTEVYNPFSLMKAFDSRHMSDYWFGTATPGALLAVLNNYPFDLTNLEGLTAFAEDFDQPFDNFSTAIPMLLQSGYITIKDYNREDELYTLGIPNGEVRRGLYNTMMTYYLNPKPMENSTLQQAVMMALRNDDIDAVLTALRDYMAALPYDLSNKSERDFQTILRVLFDGLGVRCDTEVKTARGRCDIVLRSPATVYVLELKLSGNGTADEALAQIDEKNYLIACWDDPRPKVPVGVVLDPATRTIAQWKVAR